MDVIFEPQKGRPFSIEVGFFDTVLEIKQKIEKYHSIPISNQTLVFNRHVLQDDRDVADCEILQNSHVQLIIASDAEKSTVKSEASTPPKKKISLNVKIPTSKMHLPIEMDINDTVLTLKDKIQEMEPVLSASQMVLHSASSSGELQDNRFLSECELSENAEIEVSLRPSPTAAAMATAAGSKRLKLLVMTKCGTRKIQVEVNASDNVGELRKELQKLHQRLHFHLPPEGYFFIYKQNVMDDDKSFRWHHVGQGDTIEIFNGSVTGGS